MTKGISDIIATVLVVLVVISLAGAFLLWSQRAFTQVTEQGSSQTQKISGTLQKGIFIEAMRCGTPTNVTIRNTGQVALQPSDIVVFVNDTVVAGTSWNDAGGSPATTIAVNAIATSVSSASAGIRGTVSGTSVRVSIGGGVDSSSRCP